MNLNNEVVFFFFQKEHSLHIHRFIELGVDAHLSILMLK